MIKRSDTAFVLYMLCFIAIAAVIAISVNYKREVTRFFGIAETREIAVSSEIAVEIAKIHVLEGQTVKQGSPLVDLTSPELTLKINQISHLIAELKSKNAILKNELKSRINQLNAQRVSRASAINYKIKQVEHQYRFNKELASNLKSMDSNPSKSIVDDGPLTLQIKSLKNELSLSLTPLKLQIDLLRKELSADDTPIVIQLARLEKELALIKHKNDKLNIQAHVDGIVGTVHFKSGAKVAPFVPILTLYSEKPSLVKAFIHENLHAHVSKDHEVKVRSVANPKHMIQGTVVSVGTRIVEYPVRLRRRPDIRLWGKEVTIKLPYSNGFILGEKVIIASMEKSPSLFGRVFERLTGLFYRVLSSNAQSTSQKKNTSINTSQKTQNTPGLLNVRKSEHSFFQIKPFKTYPIEASAALYLPDINRHLIVSDDTPQHCPLVFLMNKEGIITDEIQIRGEFKITDMESITQSNRGDIYIAASQYHKKRKLPRKKSRLLIKLRRDSKMFTLVERVDLYTLLLRAAKENRNKEDWAKFLIYAAEDKKSEIEGIFYNDRALYLGYKRPFYFGCSVILRIDKIDRVLKSNTLSPKHLSLWKVFVLQPTSHGPQHRISDLYVQNGILYIAAAAKGDGSLWKLPLTHGQPRLVASFSNRHLEGIAGTKDPHKLLLTFDQGKKHPSYISFIEVSDD